MNTRTQAFIVLLFGAVLLRLGFSDLLLRFVRAYMRIPVLLTGAVMVALAVWSLVARARAERAAHAAERDEPDGDVIAPSDGGVTHRGGAIAPEGDVVDAHGHRGASRAAWLVLAPVAAVLVIGPPALGAYTANRQSRAPVANGQSFGPLPAAADGAPTDVKVVEFALRSLDAKGRQTLQGREVSMVGFVSRTGTDGFVLARLVITCCAADALPVEIQVHSDGPAPRPNSWVRVTGRYAGEAAQDVPVLEAAGMRAVPTPSNPYD